MYNKIVLALFGIAFAGYGAYVIFSPDTIIEYIGYGMLGPDSRVEFIAMYGGLELGFGLFCLAALVNRSLEKPALLATVFVVGCLVITRTASYLASSEAVTSYTYGALVFEAVVTGLALLGLMKQHPKTK